MRADRTFYVGTILVLLTLATGTTASAQDAGTSFDVLLVAADGMRATIAAEERGQSRNGSLRFVSTSEVSLSRPLAFAFRNWSSDERMASLEPLRSSAGTPAGGDATGERPRVNDSDRRMDEIRGWIDRSRALLEEWRGEDDGIYRLVFFVPTGTSKTLEGRSLGRLAGRDVFRIDLSAVSNKYIGETEKNLSELLLRTRYKQWLLFFDEADALFGKRTDVQDAHDRYANEEFAYLFQRVEAFRGLVIVAL